MGGRRGAVNARRPPTVSHPSAAGHLETVGRSEVAAEDRFEYRGLTRTTRFSEVGGDDAAGQDREGHPCEHVRMRLRSPASGVRNSGFRPLLSGLVWAWEIKKAAAPNWTRGARQDDRRRDVSPRRGPVGKLDEHFVIGPVRWGGTSHNRSERSAGDERPSPRGDRGPDGRCTRTTTSTWRSPRTTPIPPR